MAFGSVLNQSATSSGEEEVINQYVWLKKENRIVTEHQEGKNIVNVDYYSPETIKYSDEIEMSNGVVKLVNEISKSVSNSEGSVIGNEMDFLKGKYFTIKIDSKVRYLPPDATITYFNSVGLEMVMWESEQLVIVKEIINNELGYVTSPDKNAYTAYPNPEADGYYYLPKGQLGNFSGIYTMSYKGVDGSDKVLEFPVVPRVVIISRRGTLNQPHIWHGQDSAYASLSGTKLTVKDLNTNGDTYWVVAFC